MPDLKPDFLWPGFRSGVIEPVCRFAASWFRMMFHDLCMFWRPWPLRCSFSLHFVAFLIFLRSYCGSTEHSSRDWICFLVTNHRSQDFDRMSAQAPRICKTIRGAWAAQTSSWFIAHKGRRKRWQDEAKERLCKATFLNMAKLPLQLPYFRLEQISHRLSMLGMLSNTLLSQRTFFVIATHCAMPGLKAAE